MGSVDASPALANSFVCHTYEIRAANSFICHTFFKKRDRFPSPFAAAGLRIETGASQARLVGNAVAMLF